MSSCLFCGRILTNSQVKYCSSQCQIGYQQQEYVKKWQEGEIDGTIKGGTLSKYIRHYLIQKTDNHCSKCGWGEINPTTNLVPLEVHHKDGDYTNNKEENLEVLCPNCHSLTSTYKALNSAGRENRGQYKNSDNHCIDCGVVIGTTSVRCRTCEGKSRTIASDNLAVSREELKKLIRTTPFVQIGNLYGVTDNAIRKWCDKLGLPRRTMDIKAYSDKDWENI